MLAQELLEAPKMSNHARGLWGYWGKTPAGRELTVQATGMGGPSAAIVLADLAELGVRRAVRIGSATGLDPELALGQLVVATEAHPWTGPGRPEGSAVLPDPALAEALSRQLGIDARPGSVASLDTLHAELEPAASSALGTDVADMQTAALFARGAALDLAVAAVLVVSETSSGEQLGDAGLEAAAKRAGHAAAAVI